MSSSNERLIYIVGHHKFQNELMAFFLERSTHAKCLGCASVSDLPESDEGDFQPPRLILWDCLGKEVDACLADLDTRRKSLSNDHSALFNLRKGRGIEQMALDRGVRGFFYVEDGIAQVPKGVRIIFDGELWVSREITTQYILEKKELLPSATKMDSSILSRREIQILSMVTGGATNEEIAKKLYISPHTVKTHVYNIFKKINVPNRLQAALWAVKNL